MTTTPQEVRTAPAAGSYELDQSHSHVSFTARHLMVTKVRGRFPVTAGKLVVGEDPRDSSVEATIDVTAVDSGDPKRDEHLRSADFFDVEHHPQIVFESTGVEHLERGNYRVAGDLTMHGETHPVVFEVTVHGVTHDPQGQDRVGLEARGTLSRGEFGLRWQQALETGGVLVGDEIRVVADIAAVCSSPDTGAAA
jgi:polyisoprenoid-binding protein YceI